VAYFFSLGKWQSTHHVYHAFHHDHTSKKPRPNTLFFQKTPQKRPKNDEKLAGHLLHIFFAKHSLYKVNRMWLKVFSSGVKKTPKMKLPPTRNNRIMPNMAKRS
jgi:fatty acid desaturase